MEPDVDDDDMLMMMTKAMNHDGGKEGVMEPPSPPSPPWPSEVLFWKVCCLLLILENSRLGNCFVFGPSLALLQRSPLQGYTFHFKIKYI